MRRERLPERGGGFADQVDGGAALLHGRRERRVVRAFAAAAGDQVDAAANDRMPTSAEATFVALESLT